MSNYEIVSITLSSFAILVSLLAFIASIIIWNRQSKLQRENLEIQRQIGALAIKQHEVLIKEEIEKTKARLKVELSNNKFYITNIGPVEAANVNFEILDNNNPVLKEEYSKLPIPKLQPESNFSLSVWIPTNMPTSYSVRLTWTNPDGKEASDDFFVTG